MRLVGRVAAGGVGQQEILTGIDVIEQRFFAAVKVHAANRYGHYFGAAGFEGARGFLKGSVFASPNQQPGLKCFACDDE